MASIENITTTTYYIVREHELKTSSYCGWDTIDSKDDHEFAEFETIEEARAAFDAYDLESDYRWFSKMEWRAGIISFARDRGLALHLDKVTEMVDEDGYIIDEHYENIAYAQFTADDVTEA